MPRLNDTDLSRRAIERGGWLSALPSDPGADPPDFPRHYRRANPQRATDARPAHGLSRDAMNALEGHTTGRDSRPSSATSSGDR